MPVMQGILLRDPIKGKEELIHNASAISLLQLPFMDNDHVEKTRLECSHWYRGLMAYANKWDKRST